MKLRSVLALTAAAGTAAVGLTAGPASAGGSASAACEPGLACFYETVWFTGKSVQYADVPSACTVLPFAAGALFNWSTENVAVYPTTDCSGPGWVEPANNFHSYPSGPVRSFRAW